MTKEPLKFKVQCQANCDKRHQGEDPQKDFKTRWAFSCLLFETFSGESFSFHIHVDNKTSKKVLCVAAYVLKTETVMQVLVGGNYGVERKARSRETKYGKKEYYGVNNQFPMVIFVFHCN